MFSLAAWQWHQAWQHGGSVKLGSTVAASSLAALGHGHASRHQCRVATVRRRSGDEDTGGDSDGGGTNNQQSTKSTEMAKMTATKITMETKGTAVAVTARGQRPAWRRRRQLGKNAALAAAASLVAEVAAWRERGVGGISSMAAASAVVATARSVATVHKPTMAAWWQQRGGCGGATTAAAVISPLPLPLISKGILAG